MTSSNSFPTLGPLGQAINDDLARYTDTESATYALILLGYIAAYADTHADRELDDRLTQAILAARTIVAASGQ